MLEHLLEKAIEKEFHFILTSIFSLYKGSIPLRSQNGLSECGISKEAGKKHGKIFDIVWMQNYCNKNCCDGIIVLILPMLKGNHIF
jgi:L-amino acid N-acyltransferase YncA